MLKWAVGQRIPSTASSTCSDINSSAACCSSTFRQEPFEVHPPNSSTIRAAYVRNIRIVDKENRKKCRRSLEKEKVKSSSTVLTRSRDNTYMHIDGVSSPLRDVSNHWSAGSCDNSIELDRKSIKRKHVRLKKSPHKASSIKCTADDLLVFVPPENETHENDKSSNINVTESADLKISKENNKVSLPMPIQFRTTIDNNNILFDKHQYFTIQMWPPEEPEELFHKELPVTRLKLLPDACDKMNSNRQTPFTGPDQSVCDKTLSRVSSIMENLSWLKLNASRKSTSETPDIDLSRFTSELEKSNTTYGDNSLNNSTNFSLMLSDTKLSDVSATKNTTRQCLKRKHPDDVTYVIGNFDKTGEQTNIEGIKSKRRCFYFNDQSLSFTPPQSENSQYSSTCTKYLDPNQHSTLIRQRAIRRKRMQNYASIPQRVYNKNFKSILTLPHGIPSPFHINDVQFKVLSRTPLVRCTDVSDIQRADESDFNVLKKAVSTPKPGCTFDLTEDVFLSPGTRSLFDSVILQTSSDPLLPTNSVPKKEENTTFPITEQTWNSHGQILLKTEQFDGNEVREDCSSEGTTSCNSSRINDDQDGFSSIVSSTPTLVSPSMSTFDRPQPRSRRCLSFVSSTPPKSIVRPCRTESGQLDLKIYYNNGLLTVYIIRARNLHKIVGDSVCNAYVKVSFIPQGVSKAFHRTCVRKNSFNPKFDHKFSMEVNESDINKRVIISAWHRDRGKQKSEFLGCMSFAIKNIMKKEINGSYKLVSQNQNKTYVTQNRPPQASAGKPAIIEKKIEQSSTFILPKKDIMKVHDDCVSLQYLELELKYLNSNESKFKRAGRTSCTSTFKLVKESNTSYGFSIAWTNPPRIERVDADTLANHAGLKPGDYVIFIDEINVVNRLQEEIHEIIQNCGNELVLEIYRKPIVGESVRYSTLPFTRQSMDKRIQSDDDKKLTSAYSATTISTNESSNGLQLPKVAFSSEVGSGIFV